MPKRRLKVPSDQRMIRAFDSRICNRIQVESISLKGCESSYILTALVFCPTPTQGIFNSQFDCHAFLSNIVALQVLIFLFRTNICIRMEWLRVHTDEIRKSDDPGLLNEYIYSDNLDIKERDLRYHPMTLGQEGSEILHALP